MGQEQSRRLRRPALSLWERQLAFTIARKFELLDAEELQAELTRTILNLKCRPPPALRSWRRYLAKALHNRADSWTHRKRALAKKETAFPESDQEDNTSLLAAHVDNDLRLAFSTLWRELDPDLQRFWHLLSQERGNQSKVARQLGKHRNTIRSWIRKIQDLLARHQLSGPLRPSQQSIQPARPTRARSVVISGSLLQKMACTRLSGTEVRILLWIILRIFRRKQKTTPFNWTQLARDLAIDRRGIARAAKKLAATQWITLQTGRIGLRRE